MAEPAGWSALPSDLLNRVADRLLATNDVDYYMDLRTVCSPSSRATDDPKNIPDPRFRPSQWIVIDEVIRTTCINFQRHTPLLVNTATGRALREYLPMLRNYYVIATTHGSFFVLADRKPPRAACVLNPFTGYLVRFAAPMVPDMGAPAAALVGSTLVLIYDEYVQCTWLILAADVSLSFRTGILTVDVSTSLGTGMLIRSRAS
ncbi:hypothetical protein D1007_44535 [Hordeum vulgare]|uniref:F-box domain-containing protein n=1 Tax=Hordeum vulgare subsp. vulgare TaxID=112509 RepID=A0A8I6XJM1_HORVV|nr:uncharacterized protein LOC123439403 [Hordeum vulgare subsp. vulgare]KAE8782150.1 hypothetical protein D1007_44535 [Hordeum vulgare]